jgi:hypothetical protein
MPTKSTISTASVQTLRLTRSSKEAPLKLEPRKVRTTRLLALLETLMKIKSQRRVDSEVSLVSEERRIRKTHQEARVDQSHFHVND